MHIILLHHIYTNKNLISQLSEIELALFSVTSRTLIKNNIKFIKYNKIRHKIIEYSMIIVYIIEYSIIIVYIIIQLTNHKFI